MKKIDKYISENIKANALKNANQAFEDYFANFDFNSIPAADRDADALDYEDMAEASLMATEAALDDTDDLIVEQDNDTIKSITETIDELKTKYKMQDYQFRVYNPFEVQIITVDKIPNYLESQNSVLMQYVINNVNIIKAEMDKCGYYFVREEIHIDRKTGRKWVFIVFDPKRQEPITDQIRNNCATLYHCSPSKNHDMIMKYGITQHNEGRVYTYNTKRIYLLTSDPKSDAFKTMMSNITKNRKKKDAAFDGKYYVYWIDVDELSNDVSFYYDAHGKNSIFTESYIPVSAIIKAKEIQF